MDTIIEDTFDAIQTILGGLRVADGYNFDWSPESIMRDAEDCVLNPKKAMRETGKDWEEMFPIVEMAWEAESAIYNTKSAQSYTNVFNLRLHCYAYADATNYVNENAKVRSDILKAFGNNISLLGYVENSIFTGSDMQYTNNRKAKPFAQMDLTFNLLWNFDSTDPERRC